MRCGAGSCLATSSGGSERAPPPTQVSPESPPPEGKGSDASSLGTSGSLHPSPSGGLGYYVSQFWKEVSYRRSLPTPPKLGPLGPEPSLQCTAASGSSMGPAWRRLGGYLQVSFCTMLNGVLLPSMAATTRTISCLPSETMSGKRIKSDAEGGGTAGKFCASRNNILYREPRLLSVPDFCQSRPKSSRSC